MRLRRFEPENRLVQMNYEEFISLENVEREHWFYRGKRHIVRYWINRVRALKRHDLLVDVGAGTGQFVLEMQADCRAVGIEFHPQGLEIAGSKQIRLIQGAIIELPISDNKAAAVVALDVLEHVVDDRLGLRELIRITQPGGLIVINVPAFQLLWSDWDEALNHQRRYTRRTFLELVDRDAVTIIRCVYINSLVFLPILAYRTLRRRFEFMKSQRLEDNVPCFFVNQIFYHLFVVPARWGCFSPPFGVSLFCLLQKNPEKE